MTRVIGIGLFIAGLTAPLAAQAPPALQSPQLPPEGPMGIAPSARFQMQVFEMNLGAAVERGAQQLVERARQVVPNVNLQMQARPQVSSVLLPEGAVFYVQIPGIEDVGLRLFDLYMRQVPPAPNNLPRMGNNSGRVAGTIVEGDPVAPPPLTDPSGEYTSFVRLALIDAMLDNSLALPIAEGQSLTLVADVLITQPTDPLAQRSRKLLLRIKGEDLIALRQNRITRDQAKLRLIESKY